MNVSVTATDAGGLSASNNFALNVINVNDTPTANSDTGTAIEDGGVVTLSAATLLANDTDPDFIHGDTLNIVSVSPADSGAIVSLVNGDVQYNAGNRYQSLGTGQTATDSFSYTVADLAGATSTAQVTMTITGANDAPVTTVDDAVAIQEDGNTVAAGNVLANDSDVDTGTVLTVSTTDTGVRAGVYGSLTLNANGSYSYALNNSLASVQALATGQTVTENFAYHATDGLIATPSTLTVTIIGTNDAPITAVDIASAQEDTTLTATGNVLTNDSDVDAGTILTVSTTDTGVRAGSYGSLTLNANGSYSYAIDNSSIAVQSLAAGQTVIEAFAYHATDGLIATASILNITITGTNDAPVAQADVVSVNEDSILNIQATTLLANDTDLDQGDSKTLLGVSAISTLGASVTLVNGAVIYDHGGRFNSLRAGEMVADSFSYTISDAAGVTSTATVNVTVTGVNDGPIALNDFAVTNEDSALTVLSTSALLSNDTDPDAGDTLNMVGFDAISAQGNAVTQDANGNLVFDIGNRYQSLGVGQTATDTFNYIISDAAGATSTAQVTMTINGVNDAPVIAHALQNQSVSQGAAFIWSVPANAFTDIDAGDTLSYGVTLVDGTALPSWLTFDAATQTFSGTPGNTDVGNLNLLVTATDKGGLSASSSFVLNVSNANTLLVANNDTGTAFEDGGAVILSAATLLSNDIGSGSIQIMGVTQAASGAAVSLVNGDVQYDIGNRYQSLGAGQTATDTFSYAIADGTGATSTATVTMTINGVNDAPVVANTIADQISQQDAAFSYTLPTNTFTDIDQGDVLSYSATLADGTALPTWLTFDTATQTFSGTPSNWDVGSLNVMVTATDSGGLSAASNFALNILNVNDAPIVSIPLLNQSTLEDQPYSFTLPGNTFEDVDFIHGDMLTYSVRMANGVALPSWLSFDTATGTFTGMPGNADVGRLNIAVTATDTGGLSATSTFELNVINVNDAPVLVTPIVYKRAREGVAFSLTVPDTNFNDVDSIHGDTLTFSAKRADGSALPTWLTFNAVTRIFSGTPSAANVGQIDVMVIATDTGGLSATDTFALIVDSKTITGTNGNDREDGTEYDDILLGLGGDDDMRGAGGKDSLDGGVGNDLMAGGTGDDEYIVDSAGDVVTELLNEGVDLVKSSISCTLGANVENLTLTGTTAINGTGNALDNELRGNSAANVLAGSMGNDTYYVSTGDSVIEVAGQGTDTVVSDVTWSLGLNLENLTLLGNAAINAAGNTLNNVLIGNVANNTLDGGIGADTMLGGMGNDVYVVDNAGDVVTENLNEGTDLVNSSITYTLGANVENLTLTGTTAINGTGSALDNILTGNSAANVLAGGMGNDTYVIGAGDTVAENLNEGIDTVQSGVTYSLGANVENLTLTGTTAINGTGNALDNVLVGNSAVNTLTAGDGNDTLNGGVGADKLLGGLGNDIYIVDNTGDVVTENANEGIDTVQSAVAYTLGANVENLTLTGTGAINGTGNALDNVLDGSLNTAANILTGGTGNDIYILGTGDTIVEAVSAGIDTVKTSTTYTLGANIEYLTLTGISAINGTGNTLDNYLVGNSAINTLTGGAGNDLLNGGLGNDILAGDAGNDILEGADGNDTMSDTAGNNLFNGGAGTDAMTGNTGNELFIGGLGNDTITTGTGADILAFNKGDGIDTVVASTGADNTISLGGGINYAGLTLSKSGTNLILDTGNSDQIILQNWYTGTTNHSVAKLQLVLDATTYNAASADVLLNQQIQSFDFALLAQNFDAALVATPTLSAWSLSNALLTAHLSGSNTAALGGDLAYQYNQNGSLAGIGLAAAQTELANAGFGTTAQTLQPLATLQTGTARLG